jgi:5-aminopentanamidase
MRIALAQETPQDGPDAALTRLGALAEAAQRRGARLLLAPEMFLTGYAIGAALVAAGAEPPDGPALTAAAAIARRTGVALCFGLPLANPAGRPFNAAALIDARGDLRAHHAKTHLFGGLDHAQFAPGPALSPVIELDGWAVSLAICYDIEFPEVARAAAEGGAELILVPTANMRPFEAVNTRLIPARALENALFIAYCNYVGLEGPFDYCGLSAVCAPDGVELVRGGCGPALLVADLDRQRLAAARTVWRHLHDRRPALYGSDDFTGAPDT